MLTLKQYIEKSNALFSYIGGYAKDDTQTIAIADSIRKKYEQLLCTVALDSPPAIQTATPKKVDVEHLLAEGYHFLTLKNEATGKIECLKKSVNFEVSAPFGNKDVDAAVETKELISKLILYKQGKYAVITQNKKIHELICFINELFFDTMPIKVIRFASQDKTDISLEYWCCSVKENKKTTPQISQKDNLDKKQDITITSWDFLD